MKTISMLIISVMFAAQMGEVLNASCKERSFNKLISVEKIDQNTKKQCDARKSTALQSHCTPIIAQRFN